MEIYIGYCGDDGRRLFHPPSNQRGGGQASGDYRDKFDLKISYRRGWKIGMDPELSSVSRMYFEFDGSFL